MTYKKAALAAVAALLFLLMGSSARANTTSVQAACNQLGGAVAGEGPVVDGVGPCAAGAPEFPATWSGTSIFFDSAGSAYLVTYTTGPLLSTTQVSCASNSGCTNVYGSYGGGGSVEIEEGYVSPPNTQAFDGFVPNGGFDFSGVFTSGDSALLGLGESTSPTFGPVGQNFTMNFVGTSGGQAWTGSFFDQVDSASNGLGTLDMQVTPEPASAILLGFGLVLIISLRRTLWRIV